MNRDRLHLWQDRLARNDSQYENWYARMDERERLYQGSRYIFPLVNKYRPSNAKTPHVRNICSELIEAQVDSNIPSPKVTAVHEKDEPLAKIIEDMLRNEMDRLPFAEINDLMERIVPIQGGGAYLVEWDNTARTHTTIGELNVVPIHPRQMVPQDGVYSLNEGASYCYTLTCKGYAARSGELADFDAYEEWETERFFCENNGIHIPAVREGRFLRGRG